MKALLIALFTLIATQALATVEYDETTSSLKIYGMTTSYQAAEVQKYINENDVDVIYMWGPGGEFYAGLNIGRHIAESGALVVVPRGKECISACAFAATGAQNIISNGKLLFHRPFTIGVPAMETIENIAGHYGKAYLDLAEYMLEMGFSLKVTREIIANSNPCKFVILGSEDIAEARLNGVLKSREIDDRCVSRG